MTDHDCLITGFCDVDTLHALFKDSEPHWNRDLIHVAKKLIEPGDWYWFTPSNTKNAILLYYFGPQKDLNANGLSQHLSAITKLIIQQKSVSVQCIFPQVKSLSIENQLQQMLLNIDRECYLLNDFKTQKKKTIHLKKVAFYAPETLHPNLKIAQAVAQGIRLARWLADLPANHCTPTILAEQAQSLEEVSDKIQVITFGPETMKELGMGALLAVAQGSQQPPRFIEINYRGGTEKQAPILLVGKGVTFDAGGISLKPPAMMEEMKYDMAGAASVIGTIKACALLDLPVNIIGLIPATENLPSGSAVKPGDVVTSLSGQTIEIVNTDAEGRLILADALTYAERFKPEFVLDMATLTGAVIIALGHIHTGLMTKDEALAERLLQSALHTNDTLWRLPLDEAYQQALESPVADMLNSTADRSAGSVTAGCFLARFSKKFRWAHLDIAGTAWNSGKDRKATGRPVALLVDLIISTLSTAAKKK